MFCWHVRNRYPKLDFPFFIARRSSEQMCARVSVRVACGGFALLFMFSYFLLLKILQTWLKKASIAKLFLLIIDVFERPQELVSIACKQYFLFFIFLYIFDYWYINYRITQMLCFVSNRVLWIIYGILSSTQTEITLRLIRNSDSSPTLRIQNTPKYFNTVTDWISSS